MSAFIVDPKSPDCDIIRANLHTFIDRLPRDKAWAWTWKRHVKTRTDPQNRALFGVAYKALAEATGQPINDWHEYMLGEYFGWTEYELFGKRKLRPARTTTTGFEGEADKLSTADFAAFYDFIQQRAAENGVHVPDPDKFWREQRVAA